MKKIGYALSFLFVGMLMPVAIWVAAGVALFGRKPQRQAEEPVLQV